MMENNKVSVITWNVNGLRSLKITLSALLATLDCDIVCLQETKIARCQINESLGILNGYSAYYSYSRIKSGYSGVVTICRDNCRPTKAHEGITGLWEDDCVEHGNNSPLKFSCDRIKELDYEGRCIITEHTLETLEGSSELVIINLYCPRYEEVNDERYKYKLDFLECVRKKINDLLNHGCKVIVVGDLNIAHKEIDHCDASKIPAFFQAKDRIWLNNLLYDYDIHDAFRLKHPDVGNMYTCWNTKLDARKTNYGTRIDYILIHEALRKNLDTCDILSDFEGSDHCPVRGTFSLTVKAASKCPPLCSKFYPEIRGKQTTLHTYLAKESNQECHIPSKCIRPKLAQKNIATFLIRKSLDTGEILNCANKGTTNKSISQSEKAMKDEELKNSWKEILRGPSPVPLCKGHKEPCRKLTVQKKGPNYKRQFYCCSKGVGNKNDNNSKCDHFQWV